jgi:hypothetical protein
MDAPPPAIPPQLLLPPPRRVRRRRGWLLGQVPLLFWPILAADLGLSLVALWLLLGSLALTWFGTTVPGKVTGVTPARPNSGNKARLLFTYYVGTHEYTGEDTVAAAALARIGVGAEVQVRVLPGFPNQARLVEPAGLSGGPSLCLLALAVLSSGAVGLLLWLWLRPVLGQRFLVRQGVATAGWIVQRDEAGRRVRFRYRAPRYGMETGQDPGTADKEWQVTMSVRPEDFASARIGDGVTVLYDPQQPSRSLIYAFADYAALLPPEPAPVPAG